MTVKEYMKETAFVDVNNKDNVLTNGDCLTLIGESCVGIVAISLLIGYGCKQVVDFTYNKIMDKKLRKEAERDINESEELIKKSEELIKKSEELIKKSEELVNED